MGRVGRSGGGWGGVEEGGEEWKRVGRSGGGAGGVGERMSCLSQASASLPLPPSLTGPQYL